MLEDYSFRQNYGKVKDMIEVKNLVKVYGKTVALEDVSFNVGDKEILGFLGPNGAGKSTTMNIMTGYLSSNSGSVSINGVDITENPDKAKKMIGFLPETPPLYLDMKVGEYLNFVHDLKKCELPKKEHIDEILKVCRLIDVKDRIIKNLSKGYKQRVGIAQALIGAPDVLIFDEPTVGLDPKQIIEVRNLIRTLGRKHTVILSTHILSEVQAVCDRIVIINNGKILADEKTDNITGAINEKNRYKVRICGPEREILEALKGVEGVSSAVISGTRERDAYTFTVESDAGYDMRKNLFFAMAEKGWPVIEISPEGVSIEDVFIRLTDAGMTKKAKRGAVK